MYVSRQTAAWTEEELAWLVHQYEDPEVQILVARGKKKVGAKGKHNYSDVANHLCDAYHARFPNPRRGETAEEFAERYKKTRKDANREHDLVRWAAETEAEFEQRMGGLKRSIGKWLGQQVTVKTKRSKKSQTNDVAVGIVPEELLHKRKEREVCGLDVFQGDATAPERGTLSIGEWRHLCHVAWANLGDAERLAFMEAATQRNKERAEASRESGGAEGTTCGFSTVGATVDKVLQMIAQNTGWGGFFCFAGVNEDGERDVYMSQMGTNRHDDSLLQWLCKSVKVTEEELMMIFTLWGELCTPGRPNLLHPYLSEQRHSAGERGARRVHEEGR
ncbi:hypothetical protein C2E23DRAFT_549586 [Lenzites betulinus]|nr:hypothetical protein C2E23DRAFT_549586 [Lenzites betulinus]